MVTEACTAPIWVTASQVERGHYLVIGHKHLSMGGLPELAEQYTRATQIDNTTTDIGSCTVCNHNSPHLLYKCALTVKMKYDTGT